MEEKTNKNWFHTVTKNGNDEFYTPEYAITPILEYIKPGSNVWCPFDTENSLYVKLLKEHGCNVEFSHIDSGGNFFEMSPPENCDYIISNPPYSLKTEVLERLFEFKIPFAMLLGVVGLFESERRFQMFKNNEFEIMYLNRRVAFFKDYSQPKPSLNPPFSSVYLCSKMLDKQIVFKEIKKG